MEITYNSNNSGGGWWLSDEDWQRLAEHGWDVEWVADDPDMLFVSDGRFLGALAKRASKEFDRPEDAVAEWERITGQDASALGCNCCGEPHTFEWRDEDGGYHFTSVETTGSRVVF